MPTAYSPRWFEPEKPTARACDMPGCLHKGEHKAPKTRGSSRSNDYHWFCLDHVQQYNKSWNYFEGMSEMEMELYWQDAAHAHRPTWKRDGTKFTTADLSDSVRRTFADYLSGGDAPRDVPGRIMPIDRNIQKALAVLDLNWPVTLQEVKTQFKALVKQYHPDVNNTPAAEDRFKKITEAYQKLRDSLV